MRKSNGNGNGSGLDAVKAQLIADAALRGATPEGIAALSASLGYTPGKSAPAAATAVPVTLEWAEQAKAALGVAPKPEAAKSAKDGGDKVTREWTGPFDGGVSSYGYPQVFIRTMTSKGAAFDLKMPLDAFMAIHGGKLIKPTL